MGRREYDARGRGALPTVKVNKTMPSRGKGCAGHGVCCLAFITWILGGTIIGVTMWMLGTSRTVRRFFSGGLIFSYIMLSIGSLLFLTGLLGWIGSYRRGGCLMKMFLLLSVLSVAAEIGGIVALNILRMKMSDILESGWNEVNQPTRNYVQEHFECCGFRGPEEFVYKSDPIDDSCYKFSQTDSAADSDVSDVKRLIRAGCKEKLVEWFYTNKVIWIVALGVLLLIQVISVLLAVYVVNQIKRADRGSSQSLPITQSYL